MCSVWGHRRVCSVCVCDVCVVFGVTDVCVVCVCVCDVCVVFGVTDVCVVFGRQDCY